MSSTKKLLTRFLPKDRIKINEPLALHTYIKLGGPADFFTVAKSADDLMSAVIAAEKAGTAWFILGGGSNILVGDLGVRGLVIKNEADKITFSGLDTRGLPRSPRRPRNDGYAELTAESGVKMSKLAAFANENGLAGLEMFMSVPGTLGGAIFNNSHYRPERNEFIGNLVEEAEILEGRRREGLEGREGPDGGNKGIYRNLREIRGADFKGVDLKEIKGKIKIVDREWFRFGYDYSRLQEEMAVVLRVKLKLKRGDPEELRAKSMELMRDRNNHQPIGRPSCGCMFKNPNAVSARRRSGELRRGKAGKLIDEAGLKGVRVGGMSVSGTHANFMVNDGTGKAADVLELMNRVKTRVKEFHGIELEPEIFLVGEFSTT